MDLIHTLKSLDLPLMVAGLIGVAAIAMGVALCWLAQVTQGTATTQLGHNTPAVIGEGDVWPLWRPRLFPALMMTPPAELGLLATLDAALNDASEGTPTPTEAASTTPATSLAGSPAGLLVPPERDSATEAPAPDLVDDGWYCPSCVEEARAQFPNIEPDVAAQPRSCPRHLRLRIVRRPVHLELSGGHVVRHDELEILAIEGQPLAHLYAATNEEIAAARWARVLWN